MATPTCPTCATPLEGGFLLENGENAGYWTTRWVAGAPGRSRWTGPKLKNRRVLLTYAWRCPSCTEVRLFAPES